MLLILIADVIIIFKVYNVRKEKIKPEAKFFDGMYS
jgi:hypothetical protein